MKMENSTEKKEVAALAGHAQTPDVPESVDGTDAPRSPLADEPVVMPANLKLRLEKCPKCQYERQAIDDDYATPFECPKCGVVYALAMEEVRRKGLGHEMQAEAEAEEMRRLAQAQSENIRSSQIGSAMFVDEEKSRLWIVFVILALLVLGALFFI
jgi:ssDNA-binding Zn-finger/Zn-ribbon topoisomerase 1